MIFRQLYDPQSSTYTYLLADEGSGDALLIQRVGRVMQPASQQSNVVGEPAGADHCFFSGAKQEA